MLKILEKNVLLFKKKGKSFTVSFITVKPSELYALILKSETSSKRRIASCLILWMLRHVTNLEVWRSWVLSAFRNCSSRPEKWKCWKVLKKKSGSSLTSRSDIPLRWLLRGLKISSSFLSICRCRLSKVYRRLVHTASILCFVTELCKHFIKCATVFENWHTAAYYMS